MVWLLEYNEIEIAKYFTTTIFFFCYWGQPGQWDYKWRWFPLWFPISHCGFKAQVCCLSTISFPQFAFSLAVWVNGTIICSLNLTTFLFSTCSLKFQLSSLTSPPNYKYFDEALKWYISCGVFSIFLKQFFRNFKSMQNLSIGHKLLDSD